MAEYALQKLIREVNRKSDVRAAYFASPDAVLAKYDISDTERFALLSKNFTELYRLGVHGLLLRPFSILHSISEADYLAAIRKGT